MKPNEFFERIDWDPDGTTWYAIFVEGIFDRKMKRNKNL